MCETSTLTLTSTSPPPTQLATPLMSPYRKKIVSPLRSLPPPPPNPKLLLARLGTGVHGMEL